MVDLVNSSVETGALTMLRYNLYRIDWACKYYKDDKADEEDESRKAMEQPLRFI